MNKRDRFEYLLKIITERGAISKKSLQLAAKEKGINNMTFWRDFKELNDKKYITNNFDIISIVKNVDGAIEQGRTFKSRINTAEKEKIALIAKKLIKNNSVIFVSTGTTLEAFVSEIDVHVKCIITNGIEILSIASKNKNIENTIILGGQYNSRSHGIYGNEAIKQVEEYSIEQVFTSATAVNKNGLVFNNTLGEAQLLKSIIDKNSQSFLLVDRSKLGNSDINSFASISSFEKIICDDDDKLKEFIDDNKI